MSKYNLYPVELKIQIIERFLTSESATSFREEFKIHGIELCVNTNGMVLI
ncbi:hypothetical protein CDIMF43_140026 [Carnobacterium divergens]|nr:hypothetical protein CDIMF43_140026 [Carnobacterium divergens]